MVQKTSGSDYDADEFDAKEKPIGVSPLLLVGAAIVVVLLLVVFFFPKENRPLVDCPKGEALVNCIPVIYGPRYSENCLLLQVQYIKQAPCSELGSLLADKLPVRCYSYYHIREKE
jgi:hypothetical protein